jgi:16S rRNA (guanine966-N2)-methyltransferase
MRLISGSSGGIPLEVPKSVTRPTQDRVRQAIFNMLGPESVPEAQVLDLFAGSGALGLECLSRGAAGAWFLEQDRAACQVIQRNLAKTRLTAGATVRQLEVLKGLSQLRASGQRFHLIFADPPYAHHPQDTDFCAQLLAHPDLPGLLEPGGALILESLAQRPMTIPAPWQVLREREYGSTRIHLLQV